MRRREEKHGRPTRRLGGHYNRLPPLPLLPPTRRPGCGSRLHRPLRRLAELDLLVLAQPWRRGRPPPRPPGLRVPRPRLLRRRRPRAHPRPAAVQGRPQARLPILLPVPRQLRCREERGAGARRGSAGRQEVERAFSFWGTPEGDVVHPAECMHQLLEQVRHHKVNIDGNICAVMATTLVLEGWQRKLDPDYNVMKTLQTLLFKEDWAKSLQYTIEGLMAP